MPANFSNLRLQWEIAYPDADANKPPLVLDLNLNSLNFDLNHTTVGPDTPFTSEMSFVATIAQGTVEPGQPAPPAFKNIRELALLLVEYYHNQPINVANLTDPFGKVAAVLQGGVLAIPNQSINVPGIFRIDNLALNFLQINTDEVEFSTNALQVLATKVSTSNDPLLPLAEHAWFVKVKFYALSPGVNPAAAGTAEVLYPELDFPNQGNVQANDFLEPVEADENLFNDELRLNYELTYLPNQPGSVAASPIGRVADEITDSITTLTTTLANNLSATFKAQLQPAGAEFSNDIALWILIKKGTDELSFGNYFNFMETLFCGANSYDAGLIQNRAQQLNSRRSLPFMNVDAYRAVKIATESFVMVNCMVDRGFAPEDVEDLKARVRLVDGVPDEVQLNQFYNDYRVSLNGGGSMIPYLAVIRRKLGDIDLKNTSLEDAFDQYLTGANDLQASSCYGIITEKLTHPCYLELIWSYWHEESMMVQGLNAISRRFQNIRGMGTRDPLAALEIDPLRSLNNLMWGYIQDEQHRLTVRRRAYEYNHHYGISLHGDAVRDMRFADSRSKFIEALHTLLNIASRFFKQSDDMTVRPDGFPLLNALRETHLILSEGAHNQYGDLPSVARAEMLMQQWMLARPEFREFLPTRAMVAYPEPWMDRVAALNQMMGWTKTSVLHFNYLAQYGEKILLSIRFGNWADAATTSDAAANWANFWRREIQGYLHAYRAATGVDLSVEGVAAGKSVDAAQPSTHLVRRLKEQQNGQHAASSNGQAKVAMNGQKIASNGQKTR